MEKKWSQVDWTAFFEALERQERDAVSPKLRRASRDAARSSEGDAARILTDAVRHPGLWDQRKADLEAPGLWRDVESLSPLPAPETFVLGAWLLQASHARGDRTPLLPGIGWWYRSIAFQWATGSELLGADGLSAVAAMVKTVAQSVTGRCGVVDLCEQAQRGYRRLVEEKGNPRNAQVRLRSLHVRVLTDALFPLFGTTSSRSADEASRGLRMICDASLSVGHSDVLNHGLIAFLQWVRPDQLKAALATSFAGRRLVGPLLHGARRCPEEKARAAARACAVSLLAQLFESTDADSTGCTRGELRNRLEQLRDTLPLLQLR